MRIALIRALSYFGRRLRRSPLASSKTLNRLHAALAVYLHKGNEAQVGVFRVKFAPQDQVLAKRLILYGSHESPEMQLLTSFVRPGSTVMDVGANVGLYSLHLSRAVGTAGSVIAVEPDPVNVTFLRENIDQNQCENVTILPYALGAVETDTKLFLNRRHRAEASLAPTDEYDEEVMVRVRRGDEICAELDCRPEVVKIDVEGAEPAAFEGLGYCPAVMLIECVPSQIRAHGYDPLRFLETLSSRGYALELINPDSGVRALLNPAEIVDRTDSRYRNVLATLERQAA